MQRTLYCGLSLAVALILAAGASAETVTITVDATANQKPIDPRIYGVAFGTQAALADLNCPLNRQGGNNMSRYNWNINTCNLDNDWYFESLPPSNSTAGQAGDSFISASKAAGAQAMLTIPMIGWAAKLGPSSGKLCSFSIAKYGAQTGSDSQWYPDAGNGILSNNNQNVVNDPTEANLMADSLFQQNQTEWLKLNPADASLAVDTSFQQNWVNHLVNTWNTAANGGLRYYLLDNEHSIWHSTHRDVHPLGATMDEISSKMIAYATMIKTIDPGALILGPEEWGWDGYFYSGYDQQYGALHNWNGVYPDRVAHGGADYIPWLLSTLKAASTANLNLLDVCTVHWYPQSGEFSETDDPALDALRNASTRSLWDPTYTDQSWINAIVELIPRLKGWVGANYPGLKIGITEYNWGNDNAMNGATTQADVLGIFGREGLDLATRWEAPDPAMLTYTAFKLYRNYDGNLSTFGDTSVPALVTLPGGNPSSDPTGSETLSAFSAVRSSDGALTVMIVNKVPASSPVTVNLSNFSGATGANPVTAWQLSASSAVDPVSGQTLITPLPNLPLAGGNSVALTVPAQSITLLVIPPEPLTPITFTAGPLAAPNPADVSQTVSFSAAATGGTGALAYTWTFGDGGTGTGADATHAYATAGSFTATVTATDVAGHNTSATVEVNVTPGESSPQVTTPTFSPVGGTYAGAQSVTLSCATTGAAIYYTTDGSTPTTASPVSTGPVNISASTLLQAFAGKAGMLDSLAAGAVYDILGSGTFVSNTAQDTDGSGFPDEIDSALGLNPSNPALTPFGLPAGSAPLPLTLTQLGVNLNFAHTGNDIISLGGALPVLSGFVVAGQSILIDVGGVIKIFTLDGKGNGHAASGYPAVTSPVNDRFKLTVKSKKGKVAAQQAAFKAQFNKGTFTSLLSDEGLLGGTDLKKVARTVPVIVLFNAQMYEATPSALYTAKAGKTGSAQYIAKEK